MVSKFCGIRTGLHSHYLFPRLVTLSQTFGFKASLDFIDLFLPLSYKVLGRNLTVSVIINNN